MKKKTLILHILLVLLICAGVKASYAGTVSVSPSSLTVGQSTTATWNGFTSNVNVKVYKGATWWVDANTNQPGSGSQILDTTGWETRSDYRVAIELRVSPYTITYSNYFSVAPYVPPSAPTLTYPSNGATLSDPTPDLAWSQSGNASYFHAQISTNSSFSAIVDEDTNIGTFNYTPSALSDGTYYWRVRAYYGGWGSWSSNRSFTISTYVPPSAPTLTYPSNGATLSDPTPDLAWSQSGNASYFHAQISTNSSFSAIVDEDTNIGAFNYTPSALSDGTYYWRVRAYYGGWGSWSDLGTFEVALTPSASSPSYVPLFRLYKSFDDGQTVLRDHFYTLNPTERNDAINNSGYTDEGVECYISNVEFIGGTPLYRLYKSSTNSHFFTADLTEKAAMVAAGYVDEGIAGYVQETSGDGFVPLFRLRQVEGATDHYLLGTKKPEYDAILSGVFGTYENQGIVGYVQPESLAHGISQADFSGIDLASGNLTFSNAALIMKGKGPSLAFAFNYDSSDRRDFPYPMGRGWTHALESALFEDVAGNVYVGWPDGTTSFFEKTGSGTTDYIDRSGRYGQLTRIDDSINYGFSVKTKNQATFKFLRFSVNPWPGTSPLLWKLQDQSPILLVEVRDWAGNKLTFNRGAAYGEINWVEDDNGRRLVLTYNTDLLLTDVEEEVVGVKKRAISFNYTNGKMSSFVDAKGGVTQYQYNAEGLLENIVYPRGNQVSVTYDTADRVASMQQGTNPVNTTTISYPTPGTTTITDPQAKSFNFVHDSFKLTGSPEIANIEYDALHLQKPKIITDNIGNATSFEYDGMGNVVKVTNARGNNAEYNYNPQNNILSSTEFHQPSASPTPTQYVYDATGNKLLSVTNPANETTLLDYYADQQLKSIRDGRGYLTTYTYDGFGNLASTKDAESNTTIFTNDYAGRTTLVEDALGKQTQYTLDELDNLTAVKNHVNFQVTLAHNANSALEGVEWTNKGVTATTSYVYDVLDRLDKVTNPLGYFTSFTWNDNGTLTSKRDENSQTIQYGYDSKNRLNSIQYPDSSSVSIVRNANGLLSSVTAPVGSSGFQYNELNLVSQYTDPYDKIVQYAYDDAGRLATLTYPGGKDVTYTYDVAGRLKTVSDWIGGNTSYVYDAAGNLIEVLRPNGTKALFSYDMASRLVGIEEKKSDDTIICSYVYTLDALGNIISVSAIEPLEAPVATANVSYTNDEANRLLIAGGISYTYDNTGNRSTSVSGGVTTNYSWDYDNMLAGVTDPLNAVQYTYDGMNNRVAHVKNGETSRYILDLSGEMSQLLGETDGSGTITAYYIYGLGLISRIDVNGDRLFYHYNNRGDTIALTDDTGTVSDTYAYDEYGKLLAVGSGNITPNPFTFVGRYGVMDEGDNLYFMRARFYDAEVGRFLSEDPLGFGGGDWNLFGYSANNPILNVDASGTSFDPASLIATTFVESLKLSWNYTQQVYYTKEQLKAYYRGDFTYSNAVGALAKESSDKVKDSFKAIVVTSWTPGSKRATKVFGKTGFLKWIDMRTRKGIVVKKIWTLVEGELRGELKKRAWNAIFN